MNYNFLRGKIVEKCGTQSNFAEQLGISMQELNKKLTNKGNFTQPQIALSKKILELTNDELDKAFFNEK